LAFLAQRQTQPAVGSLHFRLHIDRLPESLLRPRGVMLVQPVEPLQDEVPRLF
jgi:hypothetical protein